MAVAPLRGPAAHRPDDRATDRHSHRRRVIHIVDDISITVVNPTKMLDMDSQPSLRSSTVRDWAGLAARIILGATLLVAGIIKATDIDSTIWSVRTYQIVPWDLAPVIGWTMPILEIIVGLMLIFGIATRWSGLLGTLAMAVFIVGISSVWARHISLDCGCFGNGGPVDLNWDLTQRTYLLDILRDLGLTLCGVWLVIRPRSALSVDHWITS